MGKLTHLHRLACLQELLLTTEELSAAPALSVQNKVDLKNAEFLCTRQDKAEKTISSEEFGKKNQLKEKPCCKTSLQWRQTPICI